MDEQIDKNSSDDDIIKEYRGARQSDETPHAAVADNAAEQSEQPPEKKKRRGMARHLYPCPHCGELILDHFTECPKCGGAVKPRGYHVDEQKRKKVVRVFEIAGAVLSVALVVLVAVLTNI